MTEITYGVLRWRNTLDFVIARHSHRPLHKIDDVPLTALRIGLYQLRYLSRVPDRAAVDESVRLTYAFGAAYAAPFVNAVLRNALREPEAPPLPQRESDPMGFLTTTLSHPEWLVRRYIHRLGLDDAEARCRRQNTFPPVHVRVVHPLSVDEARRALEDDGLTAVPVAGVPRCLAVSSSRLQESSIYQRGGLCIQDAGAQYISQLLEVTPSDLVLDVCAAPGGKATAIAESVYRGRVLAIDKRARRTLLIGSLARRLGLTNVQPVTADGARLPVSREFERILVDAPCSSLGTLRRNPDIKWRVVEDDLAAHAGRQRDLLAVAASHLSPGGRLVYATCSSEPEENEHVVATFLAEHPDLRLVPATVFATSEGYFQTRPERDDMDGYFAAILTRI
jgi:16S rRNA (cytosine967-C5)-methyltransferase